MGRSRLTWWAAAAALAGLLAVRAADVAREPDLKPVPRMSAGAAPAALGLEVEPLEDESVAVFETGDPDVVVLWFYQGRGE